MPRCAAFSTRWKNGGITTKSIDCLSRNRLERIPAVSAARSSLYNAWVPDAWVPNRSLTIRMTNIWAASPRTTRAHPLSGPGHLRREGAVPLPLPRRDASSEDLRVWVDNPAQVGPLQPAHRSRGVSIVTITSMRMRGTSTTITTASTRTKKTTHRRGSRSDRDLGVCGGVLR